MAGWFFSADYGRVDESGYVCFIDRKKDVIEWAGENTSASEESITEYCKPHMAKFKVPFTGY